MKKNLSILVASATCAGLSAAAFAQTPCPLPDNCVSNPSFEELDIFSSQQDPVGWHNLSNPVESKRRVLGDSFSPAAVARTGTASVSISTPGNSQFRGMTCDWRNFTVAGFPFYDPIFDYAGGDIVVSGWYYIPTSAPITGDAAFIKLNVKRGNQDYATFDPIGRGIPNLLIQGHTDNEWRRYELRWTRADIENELQFNQNEGYFSMPPYPNHLKIVLSRFGFDNLPSSGTIFWDDITMIQEPAAPTCGCAADFNADGGVDGSDIESFFVEWEAGVGCSDVNQDGGIDGADIEAFFMLWEAGGC